ncbi:plasmid mobilization protein [Mycobacteroides chelonae]|uniref:plasmid mobilization protein n=1 Tax=Mycobacteroides chelonae TaxID=1774 RepID=UPI0009939243
MTRENAEVANEWKEDNTALLPGKRPRSENRQRTTLVTVRMLTTEHSAITAAAERQRVSVSAFIRGRALVDLPDITPEELAASLPTDILLSELKNRTLR